MFFSVCANSRFRLERQWVFLENTESELTAWRCLGQKIYSQNIDYTFSELGTKPGQNFFGHSKHPYMKNSKSDGRAQGNMMFRKKPEKTFNFHLRLIMRLIRRLVKCWRTPLAQRQSAKTRKSIYYYYLFLVLFMCMCVWWFFVCLFILFCFSCIWYLKKSL